MGNLYGILCWGKDWLQFGKTFKINNNYYIKDVFDGKIKKKLNTNNRNFMNIH